MSAGTTCLTPEEQAEVDKINQMSQYDMCLLWRYAPLGHPYFDTTKPYHQIYKARLFTHFDGFTPELSKALSP